MHEDNSPNIAGSMVRKFYFILFSSLTIVTPASGRAVSVRKDERS